jgi:hypothetical protein
MKNLSGDERKLLIIQGFDILADSLSGIFVTVFFLPTAICQPPSCIVSPFLHR